MTYNEKKKILIGIAKKYLHCPTLETRMSDSLDFHEVAVWDIKDALNEAFKLGMKEGIKKLNKNN